MKARYDLQYSKAIRNPYAKYFSENSITVVLGPDLAAAIPTAQAVNRALRSLMNNAK